MKNYTHFDPVELSQIELIEFGDPDWEKYPDGITITTVQCNDCGAYANDGNKSHVEHRNCVTGESAKWQRHYEKFAEEEAAGLYDEV